MPRLNSSYSAAGRTDFFAGDANRAAHGTARESSPAVPPQALDPLDEPAIPPVGRASYVLVAESDVIRSASFLEVLEPFRIGALVARDGVEAMRVLEQFGAPSVLVISVSLPRRDAFSIMSALRAVAGPKDAAIIALSPLNDLHRISPEARTRLGISSVLPHTATTGAFRAAVEKALEEVGLLDPTEQAAAIPQHVHDVVGEILRDVTSRAARVAGAPGSVAYVQISGLEQFRAHVDWVSHRDDPQSPFAVPYAFEWVLRTGDVLVVPDVDTQPVFSRSSDALRDSVRALVAVPLIGDHDRVVGALCVFDVKPLNITAPQLDALKALGRDYGFVLESQVSEPVTIAPDHRDHDAASPAAATLTVDGVTGLLTRESGLAVIAYEAARGRDDRLPLSLILVSPDNFDAIEMLGSEARDRVLRTLSQTIKVMLRASDAAVRWSPTEALVVLPTVGVSTAREVAERIREAARKIRWRDMPALSVSAGLTELPPGAPPEGALDRVQEQLAAARKAGGNRVA